ncbi:hypothetical protein V5O48_013378 [Marasmius crinis-equi]|uniref:Uncharacterized protein n=1 Tax=Marasmius crinis-equi TaxID=585013 RepID=A0ABR3F082_9AGAR
MAPPKLYKTKAEKKQAEREKSARYYERNSEMIKARKRAKRAEARKPQPSAIAPDRKKSQSQAQRSERPKKSTRAPHIPPATKPTALPDNTRSADLACHLGSDTTILQDELSWGKDCFYTVNTGLVVDSEDEDWYREKLLNTVLEPEHGYNLPSMSTVTIPTLTSMRCRDAVWEIRTLHNRLNSELSPAGNGEGFLFNLHRESVSWCASGGEVNDEGSPLNRSRVLFQSMLQKTGKYRLYIAEWDVVGISLIEAVTLAARLRCFLDSIRVISDHILQGYGIPNREQGTMYYQRPEVRRWINHIV